MSVRPVRLGHIGLTVRDLDAAVAFYETALSLKVSDRMPYPEDSPWHEGVWMRCNTDHHVLSIFGLRECDEGSPIARDRRAGLHHLAFEMASFDDLRRAACYAREAEIPVQGMRTGGPGVQLRLYLFDPEDNIVELYWGLDQIGWNGESRPYPPVVNVDLESLDIDAWLDLKGSDFVDRKSAMTPASA